MKLLLVFMIAFSGIIAVQAQAKDEQFKPKISYANDGEKLTIKERKKLKSNEGYMERDLTRVNKDCGKVIPIVFDKKFVKPFMKANRSLTMCTTFAQGISHFCKDPDVKDTVLKAVEKVQCMYGETGKDPKFEVKNKTFLVTFGPNISNSWQKTKEWLENNL